MNFSEALIFLIHLMCCAYMTGVIGLIHFAHYPAFASVDEKLWADFHRKHTQIMGLLVGPVMVLELVTAFFLPLSDVFKGLNIFALLLIWAVTFFQAVPSHNKLQIKKCPLEIALLLKSNRSRAVLWFIRCLGLGFLFLQYLKARI